MKRILSLLLWVLLTAVVISACSINININPTEQKTQTAATEAATVTVADMTQAAPGAPADANAISKSVAETLPPAGTLDSYVKDAVSSTVTLQDGSERIFRLPEICLNSDDADEANQEILDRFYDDVPKNGDEIHVSVLDYEAALNGGILSVVIVGRYDGGNSYGLGYVFDVAGGERLDNEALCRAIGMDYTVACSELRDELTEYYEETYGMMPENDAEREKTFSEENLSTAVFYQDDDGELNALAQVYAAVGGGHWVTKLDID